MASYPGSGKRPSRAPHNKYVGGEFALAISDRSGLAFPYNEMKFEWTGMFVHDSEWEPKQPQLSLTYFTDATALKNARPQANLSHTGGVPNQLEPIFPPTIPSQYNGLGIITTNLLTSSLGSVTIVIT
jgi:hypothetical protein|tara:strand:+ start:1570 stop:1953 length:384 start_codon:yes stop_codon:yes gene_type:complete